MGIDEVGHGPLAGPVVVAAAMVPSFVMGINDSKKLASEKYREEIYEQIINIPMSDGLLL
jgi:ribonuclease HII